MSETKFTPGDILLLEHEIAGIPYPTGCYVLRSMTEAQATLSLASENKEGLYGMDNPYTISREDLSAFSPTSERASLDP